MVRGVAGRGELFVELAHFVPPVLLARAYVLNLFFAEAEVLHQAFDGRFAVDVDVEHFAQLLGYFLAA